MIKRIINLFFIVFLLGVNTWANEEHNVSLERGDSNGKSIELPYGNIYFTLYDDGTNLRVGVALENTTTSQALLVFNQSLSEKILKKARPKVEFEKTFPGSKGKRGVYGCDDLAEAKFVIVPQDKEELLNIAAGTASPVRLELPIYLAKYNRKKALHKNTFKILSEDILVFNIEVKGWSERDPEYVSTKAAVDDYLYSLQKAAFCRNKSHVPNLRQQQKPYKEKRDSLIDVINTTLENHPDWYSTDKPHVKYTELLRQLKEDDLNDHTYDCGEHKSAGRKHSCVYCSLSARQIYHQLDDLYQQLRAGKLSKDEAAKKAQELNSCYQNNTRRKKESGYTDKISKFYSRIINY